ncbi:hypothetical protein AK812_SmicGene11869 [Symbiodinium microadriaticum]|uniref:Uncharacterized protein n=1 Tax=Symbiodinium microadriaticum TaxID=2951 RepID=A0A1Q9EC54_SYMMI|nr:hypothetical protein AK812_SmicGene11869 [Symbiodinium microadriaticum]
MQDISCAGLTGREYLAADMLPLSLAFSLSKTQDNAKAALETLQKAFAEAVVSAHYEAGTSSALQPRNRLDISASPAARTNNHNPTAAALQHIIDKAQARLASTREHIYISYYDIQRDIDVVLAWLNTFVNNLQHGGATASSSAAIPSADSSTLQAVTGAMPALAGALYGMQHTAGNEHWQNIAEIMMMLQTVHNGGSVSHPANVIAANRGTLTSNLAGERRFNRVNTVHAALLAALEEVEELMQPAGTTALPLQSSAAGDQEEPLQTGGRQPNNEWWLQERHHGLGNAPGTDLRSPSEALESDSSTSHRRRRMHAAFAEDGGN